MFAFSFFAMKPEFLTMAYKTPYDLAGEQRDLFYIFKELVLILCANQVGGWEKRAIGRLLKKSRQEMRVT